MPIDMLKRQIIFLLKHINDFETLDLIHKLLGVECQ